MSSASGYVLHRRRYRETSLIVDFLTAELGRVGAVARGALRRNSRLGATLQPLIPLSLSFSGRSELLTLQRAEASGAGLTIAGERLYCLLYVNELIVRLTATHDPNLLLYDLYRATLAALASGMELQTLLRRFELRLLEVLGLGVDLATTADTGDPVEPERHYHYVFDRGVIAGDVGSAGLRVPGSTLVALTRGTDLTGDDKRQARALMRCILDHHLDGRPLSSRKLFAARNARVS